MTSCFPRAWTGPLISLALAGCGRAVPAAGPDGRMAASLQALLDSTVAATPSIPGLILKVEVPRLDFSWTGAAGVSDRATGERLGVGQTFRLASNTKTYVATAVLRLVEDGKVGLADPIAGHLAPATVEALKHGGYDPVAITVRDLLQHVGGIYDHSTDPTYPEAVLGRPDHRWTRAEQVALAVTNGKPYGKPGDVYHYSDTGYILLGELLERATGQPLGAAVRSLVGLERLGLGSTWFETLDSVPAAAGSRAHQYADTTDVNPVDPSFDLYGGGGLVATIADLSGFYRALLEGRVFRKPATLDTMLVVSPQSLRADSTRGYAMGIARRRIEGLTCWGHGGYWGTIAVSCPAAGLTIAVTMNRSPDAAFDVLSVINRAVALVRPSLSPGAP